MLFKNKEELDNYLADRTREIEERIESELIDRGMTDMREIDRLINLEVEKEARRILAVAEIERPWERPKHVKLADLKRGPMWNMYTDGEEGP